MATDAFNFRLDAKVTRVTEKEMLNSLRAFATQSDNRPFTTTEYDRWIDRVCNAKTISERLGSWRSALSRIGIQSGVKAYRYSARELMDNLELVWRELGRPPGNPSMTRYGFCISSKPYISRWGSLREACQVLARFKQGDITEQQLLGTAPSKRNRAALSLQLRWDVLKHDNYRCVKCGARPPEVQLEVDHIIPVSRGGTNDIKNLRTLCRPCNQGKKDR